MQHAYDITGMHCGSCVQKIERGLLGVDAVAEAQVTLTPPRARVTMDRHVPINELNAAVSAEGDYRLTEAKTAEVSAATSPASSDVTAAGMPEEQPESVYPLLLIVGFITGTVLLIAIASGVFEPMVMMRHFMAGFFIVFGFFKLLDPPGFVSAYRGYDLLARRSAAWAWSYPFVEVALGAAYLLNLWPIIVNSITLVLMLIGAAGVLKALLDKRAIRCACLGTALNLPMTKVTLVEDLTMAAMAAVMLVGYWV
jgi:cation transport ATPase